MAYKFTKIIGYTFGSGALAYVPLGNSSFASSSVPPTGSKLFIPSDAGTLVSIEFSTSTVTPGSTIFTLYDVVGATDLGTKTVTITGSNALNVIDFTTGLDSGTNAFTKKRLAIGVDPTGLHGDVSMVATFLIDE